MGRLWGVPIDREKMKLNYLFFADDNFLFCKANTAEWGHLQEVLDTYEHVLRQKLNKKKTPIFFSKNTSDANRYRINAISGVQPTKCFNKYLGLPTMVERFRMRTFKTIKDKFWSCMSN